MSALAEAAQWVTITDILAVARGATWKDLYARQSCGGSGRPGVCVSNRGTYIEVSTSWREPGERVPWSRIVDLIRAGTTIGDLVEGSQAYRRYCESGGVYGPATTDRMAAVVFDVRTRGLAALEPAEPVGQMSLFALEAAS